MTRDKNLLLLSLISFLIELYFISPVVVFFFHQRGISFFQIILLEVVQVAFTLILEIPTGILADRIGKQRVILAGTVMYIIAYYFMLMAHSYALFIVSFAFFGIGFAFLSGTMESLLYNDLKRKGIERQMVRAMGRLGFFTVIASVIAPPLGSFIARDMRPESFNILIIGSICTTAVAGMLTFFVKIIPDMRVTDKSSMSSFHMGFKLLLQNRTLMRIVLLSIFTNPFYVIIMYLFQPYFKMADIQVAFYGMIISVSFIFASLSQRYAYLLEKIFSVKTASFIVTFVPGLIYLAMAFISHRIGSAVLFVALWLVMSLREPLFSNYKNIHIPGTIRTSVLSMISFLTIFYLIIMRLIIGYIVDYSINLSFVIMGIIIISSSIIFRIDKIRG